MNFNRIFVISFLVLVISTYQTDSGIIFTLLLKVLLLKGALFLSMPLSIGAFMMGQGMGFFAGNMMGGYMMLRAANKYHNKEKAAWTSAYSSPSYGGYGGGYGHSSGGWSSGNFNKAYDKGKSVGSALHALSAHKVKLASALHKVKGILTYPANKFKSYHNTKYGPPVHHTKYGPPIHTKTKYGPPVHHNKGWGWGHNSGGGSHSHSGVEVYDHHYAAHSEPVTTSHKFVPYTYLTSSGSGNNAKSYHGNGGSTSGRNTYKSSGSSGNTYKPNGGEDYKSEVGEILKGHMTYSNFYPPTTSAIEEAYVSYNQPQESNYGQIQDPANTFYTSAYEGPGHEYTGILTDNQILQAAQDKSSEESKYLKDEDDLPIPFPSAPSDTLGDTTVSPNPILEKYLEKRLEEEASKQKDVEQQQEAQQLIQILRRAYLKQLVESLKEEETMSSSSAATVSSEQYARGSRSIEHENRNNLIREILFHKMPTDSKESDMESSESGAEGVLSSPLLNNGTEKTITTTTPERLSTTTHRQEEGSTKIDEELEQRPVTPKLTMKVIAHGNYLTTPKPTEISLSERTSTIESETTTESLEKGSILEMESRSYENAIQSVEKVSPNPEKISSTVNPGTLSSSEKYNIISSTEYQNLVEPSSTQETLQEEEEEEPEIASTTLQNIPDFIKMPAMWVKSADNTFNEEAMPFSIRVKRNSETESGHNAEETEGQEVFDEQTSSGQSQVPQAQAQVSNPDTQMNMPADTEAQILAFVDDIKKFFTLLTVLDQDQCLQKLVCDVHTNQKDLATITPYEQNILTTFRLMKALMPVSEEDSSTKYRRAALIGETGQSLELCQQTYSTCGFTSSQIITLGSQAEASPSDWAAADGTVAAASSRSDYVTLMPRVRRSLRSFL